MYPCPIAEPLLRLLVARRFATTRHHHAVWEYRFRLANMGQEERVCNVAGKRGHHDDVRERVENEAMWLRPVPPEQTAGYR